MLQWTERSHALTVARDSATDALMECRMAKVLPLKKIQPGDLKDAVVKLSNLMATIETAGFTLYASFEEIGEGLESEAEKTRRTLELAAARVATLLNMVEKTNAYRSIRKTN